MQKIISVLRHENAHGSAAQVWAHNNGLQLDIEYGVCVNCKDFFEGAKLAAFTNFPNIEKIINSAHQYISLYEYIGNNSELSKQDAEIYKNILSI